MQGYMFFNYDGIVIFSTGICGIQLNFTSELFVITWRYKLSKADCFIYNRKS